MLENEVDKLVGSAGSGGLALSYGAPSLLEGPKKELTCPLCHSRQSFSATPSAGGVHPYPVRGSFK
jgi:hypothetical protein